MKYLILECVFDTEEIRKCAERKYHIMLGCLDVTEEGPIHHNSYYMVVGEKENIVKWLKDCYCQFDDELEEIIEDMKEVLH